MMLRRASRGPLVLMSSNMAPSSEWNIAVGHGHQPRVGCLHLCAVLLDRGFLPLQVPAIFEQMPLLALAVIGRRLAQHPLPAVVERHRQAAFGADAVVLQPPPLTQVVREGE